MSLFQRKRMVEEREESSFVAHQPCPKCTSRDGFALYDDGHGYCFVCHHYQHGDDTEIIQKREVKMATTQLVERDSYVPLNRRRLSEETCKKWDYHLSEFNGKKCHVANYKDAQGQTVAQKLRFANKDFLFIGDTKSATLYGQHLWPDGGKMVTVVEGELDALSLQQTMKSWPVVSIPNGAAGAKKSVQKNLEWLNKFQKVNFCFDQDDAGRKAAKECASLLPPSKSRIVNLPLKDANEMLVEGRTDELVRAVWDAKENRPDGILNGSDLWDEINLANDAESWSYPYHGLNDKTQGLRKGEIVTVTAGSGIGKSQLCREFSHHLLTQGETIGIVALEESIKRSALGLMAIAANKPLHLNVEVTPEEKLEAFESTLGTGRVFLYDHWGSTEADNLLDKIRYLANGCGCGFIILDHISIVVSSGMEGGDERKLIDKLMTLLRGLCEELKIGLILVSHLKRPDGKGHEEGNVTSLSQLRGSAAIGQLSDMVIGCERNQQDLENSNITTVRILKNRWTGETGIATHLEYDKHTGRMNEVSMPSDETFTTTEDF